MMSFKRRNKMMTIKDTVVTQEREDGEKYTTTLGTMEEDAKKQAELLKQEKRKKEEKRCKRQLRKEKWQAWWKKWGPKILYALKIVGIIVALGVLLYHLFYIALFLFALAGAAGGGGGEHQDGQSNRARYWRN